MYLLLCTVALTGVTLSRFVRNDSDGGDARVARFHITADMTEFDDAFTVSVTPQSGETDYQLIVDNDSETAVRVTVLLESDGNLPLLFACTPKNGARQPMAEGADGTEYSFSDSLEADGQGAYTIHLGWQPGEEGYAYAGGVAALRLQVTAEQID